MADVQANKEELNRFVQVVDDFLAKLAKLKSPQTRDAVYASGDSQLISDYESAVSKGDVLKSTIEATVGAWNAAKAEWSKVTDTTSMAIGDAVDWVRSLFGYKPAGDFGAIPYYKGLGALGLIQIPAAAWVAAIIAAAVLLGKLYDSILVRVEAARLQHEQGMSREQALATAQSIYSPSWFKDVFNWKTVILVGGGLYLLTRRNR